MHWTNAAVQNIKHMCIINIRSNHKVYVHTTLLKGLKLYTLYVLKYLDTSHTMQLCIRIKSNNQSLIYSQVYTSQHYKHQSCLMRSVLHLVSSATQSVIRVTLRKLCSGWLMFQGTPMLTDIVLSDLSL